jgi:hypothetical protein
MTSSLSKGMVSLHAGNDYGRMVTFRNDGCEKKGYVHKGLQIVKENLSFISY